MAIVESPGGIVSTNLIASPTIRNSVTLYDGRMQTYAELYRRQPNLRLVVRFLARNIAQLGLKAYRRVSDTDRVPLPATHELAQFLKSPTPSLPRPTSRHAWIRSIVEDLALYDVLYLLKVRNTGDNLFNGVRIPPTNIVPVGDSWLWPDGFMLNGRSDDVKPNSAMVYMHGHNPSDPRTGVSSVEALRQILAEDVSAGEYREQFWRNAARVPAVIERSLEAPKWSDTARNRFTSEFNAARTGQGPGAGGVPVLEDGMKLSDQSAFSAKESEYLGARRLTREECAAAYFIPPVFVGILENANFSNMKEQHISLYADTLGPWIDWLTEELELQLVPEFADITDVYLEFNIAEKLRGSFDEQATTLSTAVGAPVMTRNEGRAILNLPSIEGGDEIVTPLNVLVGGQASPRDSAPPVGSASRRGQAKTVLPHYLQGWHTQHEARLSAFLERQKSSVMSKLGAGQNLDEAFDRTRWDEELTTDLYGLALAMVPEVGAPVSERFGTEFDVARTEAWLGVNAAGVASAINQTTYDELHLAWSGAPRAGALSRPKTTVAEALRQAQILDDEDETEGPDDVLGGSGFLDPARAVFATALAARVPIMATTRVTAIGQWARREAASQAGVRQKVWVSSGADNSRHADLDGETAAIGEPFSNGGQYPGDPALGVDETAGCQCELDFTN